MKYTKVHPFDFYKMLCDKGTLDIMKCRSSNSFGEITISLSGPGIREPYSYKQPLIEFEGALYLQTSTIPPTEAALDLFDPIERKAIEEQQARAAKQGEVIVTYDPESDDAGEKPQFVQKLGLNEYRYDRVYALERFPERQCEPLFNEAVKEARSGKKILWGCAPELLNKWRERFVDAGCATWPTNRTANGGIEVGQRDPSL